MRKRLLFCAGMVLSFAQLGFGQERAASPAAASDPATAPAVIAPAEPDAANAAAKEGYLARWLDIDTFSESLRYRSTARMLMREAPTVSLILCAA